MSGLWGCRGSMRGRGFGPLGGGGRGGGREGVMGGGRGDEMGVVVGVGRCRRLDNGATCCEPPKECSRGVDSAKNAV